jgi:hypothetical protein
MPLSRWLPGRIQTLDLRNPQHISLNRVAGEPLEVLFLTGRRDLGKREKFKARHGIRQIAVRLRSVDGSPRAFWSPGKGRAKQSIVPAARRAARVVSSETDEGY